MGERVLSDKEIRQLDKDYDAAEDWDGIERRKGRSVVDDRMERRKRRT
jgi:hypothetical protein